MPDARGQEECHIGRCEGRVQPVPSPQMAVVRLGGDRRANGFFLNLKCYIERLGVYKQLPAQTGV
jgi:hypothetical protein